MIEKKALTEEYLLSQLDSGSFNELTEDYLSRELEFFDKYLIKCIPSEIYKYHPE
ncbi:hypothetical protein GCM10011365_25720 [Marinicella pacifica]|uniref:Uncharacterized protein n=1 Tax=Marinicella pacifica TaxID=1171543 RepID=A0A917CZ80_9GAMM|nr:hypothetical protein [Marinicella pacifica]GGG03422.1 hypothetical protein GCM10011365_25720 [Marinicella pacifica]